MSDDVAIVTIIDPKTNEVVCNSEVSGDGCDHFIDKIKKELYPDHIVQVNYLYSRQMELIIE